VQIISALADVAPEHEESERLHHHGVRRAVRGAEAGRRPATGIPSTRTGANPSVSRCRSGDHGRRKPLTAHHLTRNHLYLWTVADARRRRKPPGCNNIAPDRAAPGWRRPGRSASWWLRRPPVAGEPSRINRLAPVCFPRSAVEFPSECGSRASGRPGGTLRSRRSPDDLAMP
jgi:hypothetical protein